MRPLLDSRGSARGIEQLPKIEWRHVARSEAHTASATLARFGRIFARTVGARSLPFIAVTSTQSGFQVDFAPVQSLQLSATQSSERTDGNIRNQNPGARFQSKRAVWSTVRMPIVLSTGFALALFSAGLSTQKPFPRAKLKATIRTRRKLLRVVPVNPVGPSRCRTTFEATRQLRSK